MADVEQGEAEWLLDTIEGLFDFYLLLPADLRVKQDALNKKLREADSIPLLQEAGRAPCLW